MRQRKGFLATTLLLGLLLLIPLLTLIFVVVKAVNMLEALTAPVARMSQTADLVGIPMPRLLAITALLLFVFVHIVMVIKSGFRRQIRAMTVGE